jgi:hypothetical protein
MRLLLSLDLTTGHHPYPLPVYGQLALILNSPAFIAVPSPIVSASFNHTGTVFAYAAAYDWSKGTRRERAFALEQGFVA